MKKAFSIIELMIVVLILGIAGMVAIPMMSSAGSVRLDSAVDMVCSDLEYAKNMAIARQGTYRVVFDESTESYQVQDSDGIIEHPVNNGNYVVQLSTLGDGLSLNTDFTDNTVSFDPFGSPSGGGTVTIQSGSNSVTITVEAVTGYISVQ